MQLDKVLHLFVSFILVLVLSIPFTPVTAVGSTFAIGILKEVYDQISYNGWSWGDIVANVLGIAFAFIIIKILL